MLLLREFLTRYPGQSVFLVVVLLLAGVADGIGVSALLPTLQLAFDGSGSGVGVDTGADDNDITRFFQYVMDLFGLEATIGSLLVIILAGIFLKNAFIFFAEQRIGYIAASVTTRFRMRLLRAVTSSKWSYFVSQSAGSLANSMATEAWRASNAYVYAIRLLSMCIEALVYTVIALLVSWQATLLCLAAAVVIVVVSQRFVRISRTAGSGQTQWYRSLLGTLTDLLASIKSFKAMGRDHSAEEILSLETKRLKRALKREVLGNAALEAAQEPMYMVVIAVGIYAAITGLSIEMATVTFMALILTRLLRQFGKVQKQYQRMAACESAYWALEESIGEASAQREAWAGTQVPHLDREVSLQNVSFDYGEHAILDHVSLTIPANSITCLVGSSGAGKTTIADLITGLIRPTGGEISIDGTAFEDVDLHGWRQQIGYVPQENLLLHGSVRANVTLGDESASDADVEEALIAAGAQDFIAALPDGVETDVGERGAKLSGGQRQRIMIARAIVHKPRLLILDEATNALDADTESAILETLVNLKIDMTIVAISHQSKLTEVADQIVRLHQGRITEVGFGEPVPLRR